MKNIVYIAALALRYLLAQPLASGLHVLLMGVGLASITFVVLVRDQIEAAFERDLAGIDVVVGAKGSPMQLILAGVLHVDVPPGNVPLQAVQALTAHPQVAEVIPISLGDSFRGYRIVGTTRAYPQRYGVGLAAGAWWSAPMEATIGATVARDTAMRAGDRFVGTHGLGEGGHAHGETPYRVAGVLAPCACVIDRLILTATESVWQVHEKATALTDEDRKALEDEREVTLALVRYRTPLAAVTFPRYINGSTDMQAAAPAIEMTRLARMVGVGTDVLQGFALALLVSSGLSVFIALWNAVRARRADLGLLRMLGAPPWRVASLVLAESWWLAALATLLGWAAGHALAGVVGGLLHAERSLVVSAWAWSAGEWMVPAAAFATATLAAAIPVWSAYRVDVAHLLASQ